MKRILYLLLFVAATFEAAFAQNQSINDLRRIFDSHQGDWAYPAKGFGKLKRISTIRPA